MRLLTLVVTLTILGCSSEETPTQTSTAFKCTSRGFVCWDNPPLKCIGQYEDVSDPSLKNVCGKSVGDGVTDVPCCQKVADPPDTGAPDTGAADTGATDSGAADASDAEPDAMADAPASDAPAEGG